MNLLVKVMHIFRLIQVCQQMILHRQIFRLAFVAVFNSDESSWHLVEDHRVKRFMTRLPATRYLFLNPGPLPENVTRWSPEGEFQK